VEIRAGNKKHPGEVLLSREKTMDIGNARQLHTGFEIPCVLQASVAVKGARFHRNSAGIGGAIAFQNRKNAVAEITDSTFRGNAAASGNGGAIAVSGAFTGVRLESVAFLHNQAHQGSGGAIAVSDSASLRVTNGTFHGSLAGKGDGGSIYANTAAEVLLVDVDFTNSTAEGPNNGGGVSTQCQWAVVLLSLTLLADRSSLTIPTP
jgi:predicted outer membrane repeat protein